MTTHKTSPPVPLEPTELVSQHLVALGVLDSLRSLLGWRFNILSRIEYRIVVVSEVGMGGRSGRANVPKLEVVTQHPSRLFDVPPRWWLWVKGQK